MAGRISQAVWDFTYKSKEKVPFRLSVVIKFTVICIFFRSGQISDWYSLYSTMENMCRPRALQMKRSLVNRGID